jgi:hypothetical protein
MPVPPPMSDPSHIETRLLIVAEMLEKAVAEVRRTMAELKDRAAQDFPQDDSGSPDGQ